MEVLWVCLLPQPGSHLTLGMPDFCPLRYLALDQASVLLSEDRLVAVFPKNP